MLEALEDGHRSLWELGDSFVRCVVGAVPGTEHIAALLSPETYGLLVVGQGWAPPDWAEWVCRHLAADLFPTVRAEPVPH